MADGLKQAGVDLPKEKPNVGGKLKGVAVPEATQKILEKNGYPQAADMQQLNQFMGGLQQDNPAAYEQLFNEMHPNINRGLGGYEGTPKSVIESIGR